jgi:hypothetical protein
MAGIIIKLNISFGQDVSADDHIESARSLLNSKAHHLKHRILFVKLWGMYVAQSHYLFSNNMFRQCLNVVEAAPFWRSTP